MDFSKSKLIYTNKIRDKQEKYTQKKNSIAKKELIQAEIKQSLEEFKDWLLLLNKFNNLGFNNLDLESEQSRSESEETISDSLYFDSDDNRPITQSFSESDDGYNSKLPSLTFLFDLSENNEAEQKNNEVTSSSQSNQYRY